jgi:hypothetical protein
MMFSMHWRSRFGSAPTVMASPSSTVTLMG